MTKSEKENLMKMLPEVLQFVREKENKSLLSRVYGIFRVEYPGMSSIYFML